MHREADGNDDTMHGPQSRHPVRVHTTVSLLSVRTVCQEQLCNATLLVLFFVR